jgi:GH43 family beta-xylosidase
VRAGGNSPWDDYSYAGQLKTPGWAIDGTILRLDRTYFVYSAFLGGGFKQGGRQSLFITPLTGALTTGEHTLLSEPSEAWELHGEPVNEGPHAFYHGGKTFISFSGSYCWTASYALGTLEYQGGDPTSKSSWLKTGPHFSSANGEFGPGHNSLFLSPDGSEIWNAYHSTPNPEGNCGDQRYSNALIVKWNADGTPDFGEPPGYGTVLQAPSGE